MVTVVCRRLKPNNGGIQMNYTQNMKILQVKKETLVVGVILEAKSIMLGLLIGLV